MTTQPLSSRVSKRRRNRDTPPRPLNSFMIYRREYQKMIKEQNPNILLSELSRISKSAADKWANEPPSIKQIYAEKARAEKEQHMKLYPNYVYCPRRPTKTKPRKKSTSEGSSSEKMSVNFLLNDDNNSFRSYNHSFTATIS
ncbi:9980_t:CDS:1 [Acaulospora morrowiae]|uniref:9980_t:CDS:1 n=1 Tax=Acaulospora morrowiae TaxID=94023 RepID=A0A9N8YSM7_9GLOM|nr:9980_t:CDS:1 [Acaulospora morrowiae]